MVRRLDDGMGSAYAYIGLPPNKSNASVDYVASTLAVRSECTPVTSRCFNANSDISGPEARYTCDFGMDGSISTTKINSMEMMYFTDSDLSNNATTTISMPNPYSFAAVVSVNQNLGRNQDLIQDPEITSGLHGSTLFVLLCNTTVFDWQYSSINGVITKYSGQMSNSSTTNVVMGTQAYTSVGDEYILQRTSLDVWQSHSAHEIADKFAYAYSQTALAAAGGAFNTIPALEAQSRTSMLVAKVPIAPLTCLLIANMLLVLLGVILTIGAILTRSDDVGDVQARLKIDTIVAAQFETTGGEEAVEKTDDMFEELQGLGGPRIGVEKTAQDGWRFARL